MRAALVVLGVILIGGCGSSPPVRFYVLDAVVPGHVRSMRVSAPVKVDAVHVPATLDRNQMVRGESDNELRLSSEDRWAANFGDMARRVLTQDLQSRLPPGAVIAPDSPAPVNARGIVVDILSFQPDASGKLVLVADWTLLQGSPPAPLLQRSFRRSVPAGISAAAQAGAMSQLLGRLADEISGQVARLSAAHGH